jgi:2',3'-cyclic-nucleotide 2'-phosphodiesterase/3'-nucleotidase
VKTLREKEQADIIIGVFHSGWDGGIKTPDYDEDATRRIALEVPGFDVIFFGHDHRARHDVINGVLCLDPANNAVNVAQATLKVSITEQPRGQRHVEVIDKKGAIVDVTTEDIDQQYVRHFQPQIDSIRAFVDQQIGTFQTTMLSRDAFFGSSPFIDYIHELQLQHTGADVSFNAPLQFNTVIQAGPVYMSDMFKLYRYENKIYVLRMTGREILGHLEFSYDQWVNTMQSPDDHILLLNDNEQSDQQRLGFRNLTFNFDSAMGIDYEVDVTRPNGHKVRILQFTDGRPFHLDQWYRVVMNSYRGNGGGELLVRGAGIPFDSIPSRIVYMSDLDQRHYLTDRIRQAGTVAPRAHNNWRFVPEEWATPAILRDRKYLFKE